MTKQLPAKPGQRPASHGAKPKGLRGWAELKANRQILQLFLSLTQELRQTASSSPPTAESAPRNAAFKPQKPRKRAVKLRPAAPLTGESRAEAESQREIVKLGQGELAEGVYADLDFRQSHPVAIHSLSCLPVLICYRIYAATAPPASSPLQFSRQIAQQHFSRAKAPTPPTEGSLPDSHDGGPPPAAQPAPKHF